jgi:hypothetical protein
LNRDKRGPLRQFCRVVLRSTKVVICFHSLCVFAQLLNAGGLLPPPLGDLLRCAQRDCRDGSDA